MDPAPHTLVVIAGPTAVGKTSLSIQLARYFFTSVISADSRQFFREMSIGTAKPSASELAGVPHHFVGQLSVSDPYNVSMFEQDALALLDQLFMENPVVIMTGGSGLYINAVCKGIDELPDPDGETREALKQLFEEKGIAALREKLKALDPVYYQQVDADNPKRLLRAIEVCLATGMPYSSLRKNEPRQRNFRIIRIGLTMDKNELYERINHRVDRMMDDGLLEEARQLYPLRNLNALNTVGYKELFRYFAGETTLEQAITDIKTHSRRYAKRQMTWFRKDKEMVWFAARDNEGILAYIKGNSL